VALYGGGLSLSRLSFKDGPSHSSVPYMDTALSGTKEFFSPLAATFGRPGVV
jgi:hypothetical protein